MKLMATFFVAVFVMAAATPFAFGDCAGHSKAQLVKNQAQDQEQMTKEQPAGTGATIAVAEKVAETAKPAAKTDEKK